MILHRILHNKNHFYRNALSKDIIGTNEYIWKNLNIDCELDGWFSNFSLFQTHLGSLSKHRWLSPTPTKSDSVWLGFGPGLCISTKLPSGADTTDVQSPEDYSGLHTLIVSVLIS